MSAADPAFLWHYLEDMLVRGLSGKGLKCNSAKRFETLKLLDRAQVDQVCAQCNGEPEVIRASLLKCVMKRAFTLTLLA